MVSSNNNKNVLGGMETSIVKFIFYDALDTSNLSKFYFWGKHNLSRIHEKISEKK